MGWHPCPVATERLTDTCVGEQPRLQQSRSQLLQRRRCALAQTCQRMQRLANVSRRFQTSLDQCQLRSEQLRTLGQLRGQLQR